ncbi:hypothetical protein DM02DRAFT_28379 [Periconia macrospinosa]|uniref:Uncharacterized protein n=1 Tax=Periconia macrospinosa TaxID=97972 RepID=A0A2V1DNJ2_9PLEO|nr:hypothetical protein DM02DRAFT_28379 [Periconia macrospinosa]
MGIWAHDRLEMLFLFFTFAPSSRRERGAVSAPFFLLCGVGASAAAAGTPFFFRSTFVGWYLGIWHGEGGEMRYTYTHTHTERGIERERWWWWIVDRG